MTLRLAIGLAISALLLAQDGRDLGTIFPADRAIRIVVFGDFGYHGADSGQQKVAQSIQRRHKEKPYDFGLTVGDNFYPRGVTGVDDPKWREIWEKDYGALGIPIYATLGNHDYDGNPQAQVEYTGKSNSWKMPSRYYTYAAGPIRFFALDTDEGSARRLWGLLAGPPWSATQRDWLDRQLQAAANVPFRIAYGHHPIWSDGHHGNEKRLQKQLLPLLRERKVQIYLAGHDHDLQYHVDGGAHFFVVGGGGKDTRVVEPKHAKFARGMHGFLELEATQDTILFGFFDAAGIPVPNTRVEVKR